MANSKNWIYLKVRRRYLKMGTFAIIMLAVMLLEGCVVSEDIEDTAKDVNTATSSTGEITVNSISEEETVSSQVPLSDVTHLKVSEFKDYAPFYSISFQKIEGETGNKLLFEGSTEEENPQTVVPDNIRVEPEDAIWELGYWFDGNSNLADTVTLEFWNRGNAGSFMIEIDDLQYKLKMPAAESEMVTLNQLVEPLDITINYVIKYSKALLFELEGVEKIEYVFLITDANGSKVAPTRVAYTPEEDSIQLLYVFETPIENEEWTMNIKDLSSQNEEQMEYVKCNLTF